MAVPKQNALPRLYESKTECVKMRRATAATVEPRYNDVPRDWQNYIVVSGYPFKRIPDIMILEKNNQNYPSCTINIH